MDERTGHFFISVGRICEDAAVAGLPVRVLVDGGEPLEGVPEPPRTAGDRGLDDTGYEDGLAIGDRRVPLHDVHQITISRPGAPAPADLD